MSTEKNICLIIDIYLIYGIMYKEYLFQNERIFNNMTNGQQKAVLILAAGVPQAVLAEKMRKRGYKIIISDYTQDPVGKSAADVYYRTSTLDVEAIKKIAVEEKVDLIMTVCTDQAMLTVSKVSEELELPCYVSYKTGLEMTNKRYMKDIFAKNGIPSSKYTIVEKSDNLMLDGFRFPLVVKPVDCNSSKGVVKVYNADELEQAVSRAIEYSRTDNAVIEEFFDGEELSCDFFVADGKAKMLTFSRSDKIKSDEKFVIYRSVYPLPYDTPEMRDRITSYAQKIVDAYKLENCPLLMQILYNGKDISVIEFSARTGGAIKYKLIELTSGVDIIEKTIELTINGKTDVEPVRSNKYIRNEFVYINNGEFKELCGFDELKSDNIIDNYYLFHKEGFVSNGANSSGDRICGYTIIADSEEQMIYKHNTVISRIKVLSPSGEDLIRRDILIEEKI